MSVCPICKTDKYFCGPSAAVGTGWICAARLVGPGQFAEGIADMIKLQEKAAAKEKTESLQEQTK